MSTCDRPRSLVSRSGRCRPGPPHVGVDQQHARAAVRQRHRDVRRRRRLAFERLRAGDDDDLRAFAGILREQRRPQRAERFAEVVRHVRGREQRVLVAAHRRHQAEERQLQAPRHVLRRLDRVVHVVEAERHRDRQHESDDDRDQPRPASAGRHRRLRHFRVVDDAHVVRAAVRGDAQLLFAGQQRLVDLAVALRLALHHVVADPFAVQVRSLRPSRLRGSATATAPR